VLLPIDNADGDGIYTVSWSAAVRAESYELEERWGTQNWFKAYAGSSNQIELRNRPAGDYWYRCRASNSWGNSQWSNEVAVNVTGKPPGTVSPPSSSSVNAGGMSVIKVVNDCPYVLFLDFTGPEPATMQLPTCEVCKVYSFMGPIFCPTQNRPVQERQLLPGEYRVYVTVNNPSVRPYIGHWSLSGNRRYFVCFYILSSWTAGGADSTRQIVAGVCN
jgi:hypothetical protein